VQALRAVRRDDRVSAAGPRRRARRSGPGRVHRGPPRVTPAPRPPGRQGMAGPHHRPPGDETVAPGAPARLLEPRHPGRRDAARRRHGNARGARPRRVDLPVAESPAGFRAGGLDPAARRGGDPGRDRRAVRLLEVHRPAPAALRRSRAAGHREEEEGRRRMRNIGDTPQDPVLARLAPRWSDARTEGNLAATFDRLGGRRRRRRAWSVVMVGAAVVLVAGGVTRRLPHQARPTREVVALSAPGTKPVAIPAGSPAPAPLLPDAPLR